MSLVKSFSVGNGDMFYIQHASDNFSIIDCSLLDDREVEILDEIGVAKKGKGITRFISTHPDQDYLQGLVKLDDRFEPGFPFWPWHGESIPPRCPEYHVFSR